MKFAMKRNKNKPHVKLPPQVIPAFQRNPTTGVTTQDMNAATPASLPTFKGRANTYTKPIKKRYSRSSFLNKHNRVPMVQHSSKCWDSIHYLVEHCPTEIGWVGAVEQVNQFHYIIHDVRVMEQEAGPATFEYKDWNIATTEMLVKRTLCAGRIDANLGHSHVNMGVTPSGTDEDQMMDLANIDEKTELPKSKFSIQTIVNKKGEYHCAIYDWENHIHYPKCDIEVLTSLTEEDTADLDMQLKRVKTYTYRNTYTSGYNNQYGGYNGNVYTKRGQSAGGPTTTFQQQTDIEDLDTPEEKAFALEIADTFPEAFPIVDVNTEDWDEIAWDDWALGETRFSVEHDLAERVALAESLALKSTN